MNITSYDGMVAALAPKDMPSFCVGILIGPNFAPIDIIGVQAVLGVATYGHQRFGASCLPVGRLE